MNSILPQLSEQTANDTFNFYSKSLQMDVQVSLILPEKVQGVGSAPAIRYGNFPVLYLLHGTSGDHTDWERWTSIERYAAKKGLAVVMPAAQLSAYTNMVHGERYFDYIAYELPEKISNCLLYTSSIFCRRHL